MYIHDANYLGQTSEEIKIALFSAYKQTRHDPSQL